MRSAARCRMASHRYQAGFNLVRSLSNSFLAEQRQIILLMCHLRLKMAPFEVTVYFGGGVLNYSQTGPFVTDTPNSYDGPVPRAVTDTIALFHDEIGNVPWHNDTSAYGWLNDFIKIKTNSSDITDPYKPLPDPMKIRFIVEDILRRVFTIVLSLNKDAIFKCADANRRTDGPGALHGTVLATIGR